MGRALARAALMLRFRFTEFKRGAVLALAEQAFWGFAEKGQDEAYNLLVQHVIPLLHDPHVLGLRILSLAVHDGDLKSITKLHQGAEQPRVDKVHHTVVLSQVILQRRPREYAPPPCCDLADRRRNLQKEV